MISTRLTVLTSAAIIIGVVVGASVVAAAPAAEAQIAIKENGVRRADQSIVQVQDQDACTNESGEQSNDCEIIQGANATADNNVSVVGDSEDTITASNAAGHDIARNSIRNLRA